MLAAIALLALAGVMLLDPIAQDPHYHRFADTRTMLGVPNFMNVVSNIPFLIVGIAGVAFCLALPMTAAARAWTVFFAGVALVCLGSGYYHAAPTSAALVWDRVPMTFAFMGLVVALLSEHVSAALGRHLLLPAVVIGLASVGVWHYTDDLRLYAWVQFTPLLIIPLALYLYPGAHSHRRYLLYGLGFYLLAKVAEHYDHGVYALTDSAVSGHSLKHVLAAASAACVYVMLRVRSSR